jgi:hypothetical protein
LNKNEETNKYSQPLEMKFFNGYVRKKFDPKQTLSSELYDLVDKSKKIVLKPVTGKGGDKIYKIETKSQVDNALQVLATKNSFISTKFVPTSREYRVILARLESDDISFLMCLKKEPLKIKGDGKKTIKELIFEKMSNLREGVEMNEL